MSFGLFFFFFFNVWSVNVSKSTQSLFLHVYNFRHNIICKRLLSGARTQSNRNQDFPVPVLDLPRAVEFSDRWSRETQAFRNEIGVDPGDEVGTNVSCLSAVRIFAAVRSLNITMATFFIAWLCFR